MGCGASVARPTNQKAQSLMASLQGALLNHHVQREEETRTIHLVELENGRFSENMPELIESDDSIEFQANDGTPVDIIQVYQDDKDFYRAHNGFALRQLTNRTPQANRRFNLSFALNKPTVDLFFYVISSSENENPPKGNKYPRDKCQPNRIVIKKPEFIVELTDQPQNQKMYLHKGDTVEISWSSSKGASYRIEERHYCPVSGGFYPVHNPNIQREHAPKGKLNNTFLDYGMSFFVRLTSKNEIYDLTTCVVHDRYSVSPIKITDQLIEPNLIWIEQTDYIEFEWTTKRKQSIVEIDSCQVDPKTGKSLERENGDNTFFWPNGPTRRGLMYHQFIKEGVYCFKTSNDQIGTIIVKPSKMIYHVPLFGDQHVHKMTTNDLVQFNWKMDDYPKESFLITADPKSSVVPADAEGIRGVFNCPDHECVKADDRIRIFLHSCETLLLPFPQHGLFNFSHSGDPTTVLHSTVVENGIDEHHMSYDANCAFEHDIIRIHRDDVIWFDSDTNSAVAAIYQTDEHGQLLEPDRAIFQPQHNSMNYFMKPFREEGVFYFVVDFNPNDSKKKRGSSAVPLAVIVIPDITFHVRIIDKDRFDSDTVISHVNDFVVWHFSEKISENLIQLSSEEKLSDVLSCHQRAVMGRPRHCLAVECTVSGMFFFANPAFERVSGSNDDLLISTIVIDPAFGQNCFVVDRRGFVPNNLIIAQNETVSWTMPGYERDPRIYIQPENAEQPTNEDAYIQRNFIDWVNDAHHLHTFNQPGTYIIQSNACDTQALVTVVPGNTSRPSKPRAPAPELKEALEMLCQFGTQVQLSYPNQYGTIFYTLDGSLPTRRLDNVYSCQPNQAIPLTEPGLRILRAFATEDQKAASPIMTSNATYVEEDAERVLINETRALWENCKVSLSSSLQQPNKLYNAIEVQPTTAKNLIDHYEFFVNETAQKRILSPEDVHFSAEGFSGGEQYEICVVAHPIKNIIDVQPIESNRRAFEVKRETADGGPLVSLAVPKDQNSIIMVWAHIGDHVSHYVAYVDNIEIQTIPVETSNNDYGIQYLGVQTKHKYLLHVEAKVKNTDKTRKSNVICVQLPLEMSVKSPMPDGFVPYITMNMERSSDDGQLEIISLSQLPFRSSAAASKFIRLPIADTFRNAVPVISAKSNSNGAMLLWSRPSAAVADYVENYRVIIDGEQYGELLSPHEEPKFQVSREPGKYECWLEVIPKEKSHEVLKSNRLKLDIPPPSSGIRKNDLQSREPENSPIHRVLEQKDLPIPKSSVQTINSSSIRVKWHLDRPIPAGAFIALYEVHVLGEDFPDRMSSDQQLSKDGNIEHVWNVDRTSLEIAGISERQEYTIFVRAFYQVKGLTNTNYVHTDSNEITTARIDPLIDLLTRPLLKVVKLGNQSALLSWKLDDSVDQSIIKGYRIVRNSKATEILSPKQQHEYEIRDLKPGTTDEIQVSVTTHPDFVDEKVSEPIQIVCPERPSPPKIEELRAEKPFSIYIQWKHNASEKEEISAFRVFLDGKLHGEVETSGRKSFKYELHKLDADREYSIYVKSVIGEKKLDGYAYRCPIESNTSNELALRCAAPPKGTTPRLERMYPHGVELTWDAPVEHAQVKITGYQVLKNGRAIGKSIPVNQRRTSINDLNVGNRYSFQVVPITDQPGGTAIRSGEEYDPQRHGHYLPGAKLEVEFTDLIQLPEKFWIENITGRSALACWSPVDQSSSNHVQPDSYNLLIWNDKDIKKDKPKVVSIPRDQTSAHLKDLQTNTSYEIQLQACQKRRQTTTHDSYTVTSTSEILSFQTGSPPEAPSDMHLIACTNNAARIGFDPFIEHNAEIIILRAHAEPATPQTKAREINIDLTPDAKEFLLSNLLERTTYSVTIYAITEEYLAENHCRDVSQLPKKLKPSDWLSHKSFEFMSAGCEPPSILEILTATSDYIALRWEGAKAFGSSEYFGQALRWKMEQGEEQQMELSRDATNARIPGILPSGLYKITLDSVFSIKINLDESNDETGRREIRLSTSKMVPVRYTVPNNCEKSEIYLTGYTSKTLDLTWTRPHLFTVSDHPEKIGEQMKIHRRLIGYRIDVNGQKRDELAIDQDRCTLTQCLPDQEYRVQLTTETVVNDGTTNEKTTQDNGNPPKPEETPSNLLIVRTLKDKGLLDSLHSEFVFNQAKLNENASNQKAEKRPLGSIEVKWVVSDSKTISHFVLQWRSSKDLRYHTETLENKETSLKIDNCDETQFYTIDLVIVTNDQKRHSYPQLTIAVPGAPDAPKIWLVKTSDTNFTVEWSEPKSHGIPIVGFQLFVAGKKSGDMIETHTHRADIPCRINRTYEVFVYAITSHPERSHSAMSEVLTVITAPTTDLVPTLAYHDNDGTSLSFDRTIARIIPVQIESVNEEKLHVDWTSFLPTAAVRAYYIQYTCLNTGEVHATKVPKRLRQVVLRGLRPGFTYGIMVMAVDRNGGVLYTSEKSTFQMNAPPNAPIVAITERTTDHVKIEWRPAASYGEVGVVGYKIFVNNRLAAILSQKQLSYTLTNGIPCDFYSVQVQAVSNEKSIVSPMSRSVEFSWPGVRAGAFRRVDDGQTGTILLAWDPPRLEDETEKLIGFKLCSQNMVTQAVRLHGEYDAGTYKAAIYDLANGKYRIWLDIQTENYRVQARPITVTFGRSNMLVNRTPSLDSNKFLMKKSNRFRSPAPMNGASPLRQSPYS